MHDAVFLTADKDRKLNIDDENVGDDLCVVPLLFCGAIYESSLFKFCLLRHNRFGVPLYAFEAVVPCL